MTKTLLYLPYLPNIEWFTNFMNHGQVFIEWEENFVKSSHRNRCEIAGANGKQILTIPIIGGRDHHQLYKDVKIAYNENWQGKHWQSIRSAYGSSPFFEFYADKFQPFYEKRFDLLFDFNIELLKMILSIMKLKKEFELTASYEKSPDGVIDLRTDEMSTNNFPRYHQVFADRNGFIPNLSVIDWVFNEGVKGKSIF